MANRINYRTTSVGDAAILMIRRHGLDAGRQARNREDATENEARARFWQNVEHEIGRLQAKEVSNG